MILCEPLEYADFVSVMKEAYFIMSDSGGVQEEGPALAKPVLVLRSETERPEAVAEHVVQLVGTDTETILQAVGKLLSDDFSYRNMAKGISPYGDGKAAQRICDVLANHFNI